MCWPDATGRQEHLPDLAQQRTGLPAVGDERRPGVYTRWEYTDKPLWRAQKLWTVNPDGTQVNTLWGNQSVWPDLLKDARSIPGSQPSDVHGQRHHNWFSGSVGIIDPDHGLQLPGRTDQGHRRRGLARIGQRPGRPDRVAQLSRQRQLRRVLLAVSRLANRTSSCPPDRGGKFVLYLMDVDGNRELIYEGVHNIFHALPVRPRPVPPVLPDRVAWPSRAGAAAAARRRDLQHATSTRGPRRSCGAGPGTCGC